MKSSEQTSVAPNKELLPTGHKKWLRKIGQTDKCRSTSMQPQDLKTTLTNPLHDLDLEITLGHQLLVGISTQV